MLSRFSCVQLFATPWTIAHQAPLSKGFSRQEYWSGLPRTPPGDLPNPGIKPESPAIPILLADSLLLSHQGSHLVLSSVQFSSSVISDSSRPHGLQPTRLLCPWDFPDKSTGVGCHCLLQEKALPTTKRPSAARI